MKLGDLLDLAARRNLPPGWLFLPRDWRTWREDAPAFMLDDAGEAEGQFGDVEAEAERNGFRSTIDGATVEDVVDGARHLGPESPASRIEALVYYVRFDAFLPRAGAPDPPPWEETQRLQDRQFLDSLGPERPDVPCRSPGCTRGAVRLSALCKVHHFEQVRGRACPFAD